VLPAYNEERALTLLLPRLAAALGRDFAYRVLVVDDGSSDATAAVVRDLAATMPVQVERHAVNLGLGAAIRSGLVRACAETQPLDAIVTLDADNSHDPTLIPAMVQRLSEGSDVVIASRFRAGSAVHGVPWHRRAMSRIAWGLFVAVFPTRGVRDFTCGFRAYRASALKAAVAHEGEGFFDQKGLQCMVDILLKLRHYDLTFSEVPLVLRYDLKEGASKMRVARTAWATLRLLARHRLGGRRSRPSMT
jgi:dolichol-phosphate mannosyltransferase